MNFSVFKCLFGFNDSTFCNVRVKQKTNMGAKEVDASNGRKGEPFERITQG